MSKTQQPSSANLTSTRHIPAGEILFQEGDDSDRLYLIQSGQISIRRMRGLQMIEIARLHEGEVLGELAFFDRAPRSATAMALQDAKILEIPYDGLDKIWDQVPQYLKAIITAMVARLRKANDVIRQLKNEEHHGNEAPLSSSPVKEDSKAPASHQD